MRLRRNGCSTIKTATEAIYAELGEVVSFEKPSRVGDKEITVFKSVGITTERMAVARAAYGKSLGSGGGREI